MNTQRNNTSRATATVIALTTFAFASIGVSQTPPPNPSLTPPTGGPADGVFKTLDQVEPRIAVNAVNTPPSPGDVSIFEIRNPGSYYLTANIVATGDQHGIKISADGVTLDLNGFVIDGSATTGSSNGVWAVVADGTTVTNGQIRGWSSAGVTLGEDCVLEDLQVIDNNRSDGLNSGGATMESRLVVRRCSFVGNGFAGIFTAFSGVTSIRVAESIASENRGAGFFLADTSVISGCRAIGNTGSGIRVAGGEIRDCYAEGNGGSGIDAGVCRILDNYCSNNATGIKASGSGSFIARNVMRSNTTQFDLASGSVVGKIYAAPLTIGPNSGAGTAGGVGAGVGTTDPWANFTY